MGDVGFTLWDISTHAPREGSDVAAGADRRIGQISTHAPREGSDQPNTNTGKWQV